MLIACSVLSAAAHVCEHWASTATVISLMAASGMQGQALPFKMPCMEWRLVCTTPRSDHTSDEASIWRPYGAPRYCSLGDVLRKGREQPSHPVAMYLSNQHSKRGGESPFVHPVHYLLVWREFSAGGLTIWRGQPPEGYLAVGCVASKGLSPPPRSAMACIRKVCFSGRPVHQCIEATWKLYRLWALVKS